MARDLFQASTSIGISEINQKQSTVKIGGKFSKCQLIKTHILKTTIKILEKNQHSINKSTMRKKI
jgi:hypothetical protein